MARAPRAKNPNAAPRAKAAPHPHLPDPKKPSGPYRPFTDPGLGETWWWLGIPVAAAVFVLVSYRLDPDWYRLWVVREAVGLLETAQFIMMVIGLAIAVQLLFDPFVRRRPFVLAVTIAAAISCLYIGGEEVSWGQHIVFWQDPELVSAANHDREFSIHNMYGIFEKAPRTALEIAVLIGGIIVPAWCALYPRWRASRVALFLPSAVLLPAALGAMVFKIIDVLAKDGGGLDIVARPSEAIEVYLYFFILAYLVVFERRIRELETEDTGTRPRT